MMRINLLTQRKRARRTEGGQAWLAVVLVLILVEVACCIVYHGFKQQTLTAQEQRNTMLSDQIQQLKKSVENHGEVKTKLAQFRAREEAIAKLQRARSGPTAILLELSHILTPNRGPSIDPERLGQLKRDNPLASLNPGWDGRRLWLTSYKEDSRKLRLEGLARDGEDVSELARRMGLSDYFANVRLLPGRREVESTSKLEMVRFSLEAEVKY